MLCYIMICCDMLCHCVLCCVFTLVYFCFQSQRNLHPFCKLYKVRFSKVNYYLTPHLIDWIYLECDIGNGLLFFLGDTEIPPSSSKILQMWEENNITKYSHFKFKLKKHFYIKLKIFSRCSCTIWEENQISQYNKHHTATEQNKIK
jgi:hypothetical protein